MVWCSVKGKGTGTTLHFTLLVGKCCWKRYFEINKNNGIFVGQFEFVYFQNLRLADYAQEMHFKSETETVGGLFCSSKCQCTSLRRYTL
jgi:hypothetical protein